MANTIRKIICSGHAPIDETGSLWTKDPQVVHVFNAALLHAYVIKHLNLPITSEPPISKAFLGIAKANLNGTLQYYDSNQVIKDFSIIPDLYPYLSKWFN